MTLVACGLLALGVLAFMISPMLEGSGRRPGTARSARSALPAWSARSRRDDLLKKKDFIYSAIRELNIDYHMGKLAAEDHEALRQEYMKEASDVLDELDRTAGADLTVEEQIEEAVLEVRQRRGPAATGAGTVVSDKSSGHEESADPGSDLVCGSCGKVNESHANFCIECGASLKRNACGSCGTENPANARFCAQCGEKLT